MELVTAEAFITTTTDCPELLVTLWILIAEPVVPPVRVYEICVLEAVTAEFVIVNVKVDPALMVGVVIVIWPARALSVAVVVPEVVPGLRSRPVPVADATKFPEEAVMFPAVTVIALAEVTAPVRLMPPEPANIPTDVAPVVFPKVLVLAPVVAKVVAPVLLRVVKLLPPPPKVICFHVSVPPDLDTSMYATPVELIIPIVPSRSCVRTDEGALVNLSTLAGSCT